jgi:hypothetical protein
MVKKLSLNFNLKHRSSKLLPKTAHQKTLAIETKITLLKKQKSPAEYIAERSGKKVIISDMLVDLAEKEYPI